MSCRNEKKKITWEDKWWKYYCKNSAKRVHKEDKKRNKKKMRQYNKSLCELDDEIIIQLDELYNEEFDFESDIKDVTMNGHELSYYSLENMIDEIIDEYEV